ncbi:MAG TPA: hypothetical protein VD998_04515 [Verrucomicrobiae bacterium]|nr:hypothetical protein [Verrucomicrobiae bacterium]
MELDWPLSYQDSQSRYPPTNVGFDMHTLILEDMEITTGPFRGRWVRPVITTYFVLEAPRKNTETGRLFQVEQPCVNTTGEDGNPPAPPAPAPPPPPPQPPPSTAAPPPPPTKTDVEFFKIAVNKDGEPRDEVPESFSSIRFVGTAGGATYPVEFAGISKFTWTDADGDRHEAERARFLVRGVTFGPADLTLAIREDAVPRGFEDQTKLLNIAIPPDGKWLVHQPSSEPPLYKNLRKGSFCGRYAWKCWAPIAIAGGVTYVVTRGDNPREPQPVKRGGPGGSP